jgi:sarcosine oxidase subunit beta
MKTDIAIIGGGVVGCAAAYYLAQKGFQVVVVEKDPGVGLQASGRNGGGVRQHSRKGALPLAMESVKLWATLSRELNTDLEYVRTGNLKVALDEDTAGVYERETVWEHDQGLSEVRMVSAEECYEMVPGFTGRVIAGKLCSTDGIANPMLITPAYARAGIKLGVKFLLNTAVTGLLLQGSTVCGVRTASEEIHARFVINCAGPWAARFNAETECPIIIGPGRSQLLVTERLNRPFISKWVTIGGLGYMRPTHAKNFLIGSSGTRNDQYAYHVNFNSIAYQMERLGKLIPWMKDISIIRAFSGITEYTPDHEPYIGAVPGVPGLYIAAAFCGEGFCPGPLTGKILSELISGNEPIVSLAPFRPDRFVNVIKEGKNIPPINYPFDNMFKTWVADASMTYTHSQVSG